MSESDEEINCQTQTELSKADLRRSNKPIMEKKRRARINQCLDELKSLILEAMKKDPERHLKLEKADILEMTVKHLHTIQRRQLSTTASVDPRAFTKFRTGFSDCADEVSNFVGHLDSGDFGVKQRLVSHLNSCVQRVQQLPSAQSHHISHIPDRLVTETTANYQNKFQSGDENNNRTVRIPVPHQRFPSKLPSVEMTLLQPTLSAFSKKNLSSPTRTEPVRVSAFSTVRRPQSPILSPSTSTSSFSEDNQNLEQHYRNLSPMRQHSFNVLKENYVASKYFSFSDAVKNLHRPIVNNKVSKYFESNTVGNSWMPQQNTPDEEKIEYTNKRQQIRQPLSVITDKTYNQTYVIRRKNLKRLHSNDILVISDKIPKYEEGLSTTLDRLNGDAPKIENKYMVSFKGFVEESNRFPQHNNNEGEDEDSRQCLLGISAESSESNINMWRPW